MPFTPFHFGPALAICLWDYKKKRLDLPAALLGAIIVDIRATYIFFFGSGNFHDGPFHTFLLTPLLGIVIGGLVHILQNPINIGMKIVHWKQKTSLFQKVGI